jgi:uncharacterized protein
MLTRSMIELVERQRLGFVATVCPDGSPNVSPKGTFLVLSERALAFGDICSPQTVKNIVSEPRVEVNFVDPLARRGLRARGRAHIYPRGESTFSELIPRFERWGDLARRIKHIVYIDVESAAELRSPAYDDGATEESLRAHWTKVLLGN